jgi:hypothetical protein
MVKTARYWFRAKRYGFGWGAPTCWQGWVVMTGFVAMFLAAAVFTTRTGHDIFALVMLPAFTCFTGICLWKGEPLRWRWGED